MKWTYTVAVLTALLASGCEPTSGILIVGDDDDSPARPGEYEVRPLSSRTEWFDWDDELASVTAISYEYDRATDVTPIRAVATSDGEFRGEARYELTASGLPVWQETTNPSGELSWKTTEWDEETRLRQVTRSWAVHPDTPGANPTAEATYTWGEDEVLQSHDYLRWDETGTFVAYHELTRVLPGPGVPARITLTPFSANERLERFLADGSVESSMITSFDDAGLPVRTDFTNINEDPLDTFWWASQTTEGRLVSLDTCDEQGGCEPHLAFSYDLGTGWVTSGGTPGGLYEWRLHFTPHPFGRTPRAWWFEHVVETGEPRVETCEDDWAQELLVTTCTTTLGGGRVTVTPQEVIELP